MKSILPFKRAAIVESRVKTFALVTYLLMVALTVILLVMKRDGLQFHQRDYNYFVEQAARLSDPLMTKRFAMNIEGFNFLGLQGIEGTRSLIQAIHTEYFRYTYTVLYSIFRSTLPLYIFYSMVFFLPVLYIAFIPRPQNRFTRQQIVLFILLFLLFPATMPAATADLRPRMLFFAAWILAALAVLYQRPFLEKLLMFGFLLSVREEGILLGAVVVALNFLMMQGKPNRWKESLVFLVLDGIALALFLAFMAWGGYNRVDEGVSLMAFLSNLLASPTGLLLIVAVLIVIGVGFTFWKQKKHFPMFLILLVYSGAILMTGAQLLREAVQWYGAQSEAGPVGIWDLYVHIFTNPFSALFFYTLLPLLIFLIDRIHPKSWPATRIALLVLCLVFAGTSLVTFLPQVTEWNRALPSADIVWEFVESHDRYQTNVLLDYSTYQAFYHYDNVLVYNRLPVWLVWPVLENRYYPQNTNLLVREIQQRMEYAVVSRESLEAINRLAGLAGASAEVVAENDRYVIIKLR